MYTKLPCNGCREKINIEIDITIAQWFGGNFNDGLDSMYGHVDANMNCWMRLS